ncbi:elongation factor P [Pontiella sulfatireligans]|uniref:Elongation factor P n=1 Tax=Pontiella sulfatireligans TaxID=2750658 RepID=A0A6C2UW16_9BACT|nr:elongation factor P [Pontiella sulfatireligans]VGO23307.1 Elongation factor P [Pontiella sulfatireligans]
MYSASDLKKGLKIEIDGDPCMITNFEFSKPGKGQALYRCKIKNLITGNTFDKTYRSVEKVNRCALLSRDYTFSYIDGGNYVFSDNETFEEALLSEELLGDLKHFIVDDMQVEILFHNERALDITLPNFVEMIVAETEPGARGDTATNVMKPAKLENGFEINVPIFINEGDTIRIDTRTGTYADRVAKG